MAEPPVPTPSDEAVEAVEAALLDLLGEPDHEEAHADLADQLLAAIDLPRLLAEARAEGDKRIAELQARCDEWDVAYANLELRALKAKAEAEAARTAEIERLREALAQLMYEARAYIEPYGSSANPAMRAAREALVAHFNPEAEHDH